MCRRVEEEKEREMKRGKGTKSIWIHCDVQSFGSVRRNVHCTVRYICDDELQQDFTVLTSILYPLIIW